MISLNRISYLRLFRIFFVICSLYLLSDAFSRWDGFSYYATFSEFIPSVMLVTIIWAFIAAIITLIAWIPLRLLEFFCVKAGWKINSAHFLLFTGFVTVLGAISWLSKKKIWPYSETSHLTKLIVLAAAGIGAVALTFLLYKRAERIVQGFHERVTPLFWIFGLWLVLSFPVVIYHAWIKPDNTVKVASGPANADSPNIVFVTFDTLTARDMSAYGYTRDTTPFLRQWAKEANLFTRFEAENNYTTPTTSSLMTGKRVWTHQNYHIKGSKPLKSEIESLPRVLKENGYYSMAFVVNPAASVRMLGVSNSFDLAPSVVEFSKPSSLFGWNFGYADVLLYRMFGEKIRLHYWILQDYIMDKVLDTVSRRESQTTVPPKKVFDRFFSVIDSKPSKPFFAWLHLFPPHYPYLPPEPYMGEYNEYPVLNTFKSQKKIVYSAFKFLDNDSFPDDIQAGVNELRDRYDEFIKYCDSEFEYFIRELQKRDVINDTVIIFSSDHGESFQHGYLEHGGIHLYEQVTHLPLIIKEPGQQQGRVIDDLTEQVDVPATILDIAGVPVPQWMEGRSALPLMRDKELPKRPIFSMAFENNATLGHKLEKGTIAVWEDNYKLIHYLDKDRTLLFNLKDDPEEMNNLTVTEPVIAERLLGYVNKNLSRANEMISREWKKDF